MSILIEGISLPQKGKGETLMLSVFSSGLVDYKLYSESTNHRTIAIALPSKHGRIIDADLLKENIKGLRLEKKLKDGAVQTIDLEELFNHYLDDAPTVIEARS